MTMIAYAFLQYRRLKNSKVGKKESTGRRRDRHCPPCARPSSNSSLDHRRSDARAAENGFAAKSSVNKSTKVVLGRVLIKSPSRSAFWGNPDIEPTSPDDRR